MRTLVRIAASTVVLVMAYATLLGVPAPLFSFSVRAQNLTLHSDHALPQGASLRLLAMAQIKLRTSPLYSTRIDYDIFICNARWREALLFNKDYGVAGVVFYPISPAIFPREANVEANRLISPRGIEVPGDRPLDYFLVHEVTHQVTGHFVGPLGQLRMPQWVREGYTDYVGKGSSFDYRMARRAFLEGKPEMDWAKSGLYVRFHLLVAHLLERRAWTVEQLLRYPPPQDTVEAWIRAE